MESLKNLVIGAWRWYKKQGPIARSAIAVAIAIFFVGMCAGVFAFVAYARNAGERDQLSPTYHTDDSNTLSRDTRPQIDVAILSREEAVEHLLSTWKAVLQEGDHDAVVAVSTVYDANYCVIETNDPEVSVGTCLTSEQFRDPINNPVSTP